MGDRRLIFRRLLWVDGAAGAVVGVAVLALSGWLSDLEGLPREVLLATGAANLLYAAYACSLAARAARPIGLVVLLVGANAAWALVCLALVAAFAGSVTPFGVLHLGSEAAFVGGLAALEWRHRHLLAGHRAAPRSARGSEGPRDFRAC